MLYRDTPEDDLKRRIKELEEYVLRIEESRCNIAIRLTNLETAMGKLGAE